MTQPGTSVFNTRNYLVYLPLGALIAYSLAEAWSFPNADFANYYFAAKLIASGDFGPETFDPATFNLKIASLGYGGHFLNFSPNPPALALLHLPFLIFDIQQAHLAFNLLGVALFILAVHQLRLYCRINPWTIVLLPVVFAIPIRNGLLHGQTYFVVTSLIIFAYLAFRKNLVLKTSILMSIAIAIKLTPVLLLGFFLSNKNFKTTASILLITSILYITPFLLFPDTFSLYHFTILPRAQYGELVSTGYYFPSQSSITFLKTLFVYQNPLNMEPWIDNHWMFVFLLSLFVATVLLLAYRHSAKNEHGILGYSVWILAIFLITAYGSTYGRILLLPAWFALLTTGSRTTSLASSLVVFAVANFPFTWLSDSLVLIQFSGLILLFLLFVYLTRKSIDITILKPGVLLLLLLMAINYFRLPRNDVTSLPVVSEPLIIDFETNNGRLEYTFWNGELQRAEVLDTPINTTDRSSIRVVGNQLEWNGRLLTQSYDNKKNAVLIDDSIVLYMSDLGRGYGFYSIRQIELGGPKIDSLGRPE